MGDFLYDSLLGLRPGEKQNPPIERLRVKKARARKAALAAGDTESSDESNSTESPSKKRLRNDTSVSSHSSVDARDVFEDLNLPNYAPGEEEQEQQQDSQDPDPDPDPNPDNQSETDRMSDQVEEEATVFTQVTNKMFEFKGGIESILDVYPCRLCALGILTPACKPEYAMVGESLKDSIFNQGVNMITNTICVDLNETRKKLIHENKEDKDECLPFTLKECALHLFGCENDPSLEIVQQLDMFKKIKMTLSKHLIKKLPDGGILVHKDNFNAFRATCETIKKLPDKRTEKKLNKLGK